MHRISTATVMSALLFAAGALAAPGDSVVVQASAPSGSGNYNAVAAKVSYGDLDVSTNEGAKTLEARIEAAARTLCGTPKGWEKPDAYETCRKHAIARAIRSVDSPALTQIAGTP